MAILENQLGNLQKNLEKDVVGMNVLQAIVLYGVTVSSYNQVEPFYDQVEDNQIGEVDSEAEDEP